MQLPKSSKHSQKLDITKFIKKQPKDKKQTRDKNQYYFKGFYDRLKNLDVKQGHSMEMSLQFDSLMDTHDEGEMQDQLKSNFIAYLRIEKMNNRTVDFKKVYEQVEPLAYSHALILINKKLIVAKLLNFLKSNEDQDGFTGQGPQQTSDTVTKGNVLELMIALIKDLRQEIYQEFITNIMPTVISVIDVQNISILDKIFTLFSYSFKYLLKPIREDFSRFYSIFQEVTIHKNRHLRHFAAQCFSYVVRKMDMDTEFLKMILNPLEELKKTEAGPFARTNMQLGMSDILFEVMYGASEELHSKSKEVIQSLFSLEIQAGDVELTRTIRFLFIKLFNSIDSSKQQTLFDSVHNLIFQQEEKLDETKVNLGLDILQDAIKLKMGRRISHLTVIQIVETMNTLMTKSRAAQLQKLSAESKQKVVETLSLIYYFKHSSVIQVFQQSQVDFVTSKSIFTNHVYKCCADHIHSYFNIFVKGASNINSDPTGLGPEVDFGTILGLKTSSSSIEFTAESHIQKLKLLFPTLKSFVNQQIETNVNQIDVTLSMMALLNQLYATIKHTIPTSSKQKCSSQLSKALLQTQSLIEKVENSSCKDLKWYTFLTFCNNIKFQAKSSPLQSASPLKLNLEKVIKDNLVLSQYSINAEDLQTNVLQFLCFQNYGFQEDIVSNSNFEPISADIIQNPSNLVMLKRFKDQNGTKQFTLTEDLALAEALSSNLILNSRSVRIETLRILSQFQPLTYDPAAENQVVSDNFVDQYCECLKIMHDFEITEIGFTFEKSKQLQIERLEAMINSGVMPKVYLMICYNFLVGCLWIKFTPLFDFVHSCIQTLIRFSDSETKQQIIEKHSKLLETMCFMSQIEGHQNEFLVETIKSNLNKQEISQNDSLACAYLNEAKVEDDFLEIKDFFYQNCKCLGGVLSGCILSQKHLREPLMKVFYEFLQKEFQFLHQKRNIQKDKIQGSLQDQMIQANMLDSDSHKAFRRQAYSTLGSWVELFKKAENLRQIPQISIFHQLMLNMLNTTDNKMQKGALDCLVKSGYLSGLLNKYKKLLEGFCDDEKFKDMIPVLIHGSQARTGDADVPDEYQKDSEDKIVQKSKRKETKSVIPKLEDDDRALMLPIIIKLLQSKLLQKKGAINQKSLYTRRNIVYLFYASLNPVDEFPLFMNELLSPVNLDVQQSNSEDMLQNLSRVSFNTFLSFVNSVEVVLKQMGTLLMSQLPLISTVLVKGVLKLSKMFIKQMKGNKLEDSDEEMENESDQQQLHRNAAKQAKECFRKGLSLVKDIYRKFSHQREFIQHFSQIVYEEIIQDQLPILKQNYVSDKSQLLEILCLSWADHMNTLENYEKYPEVIPAVMQMLSHKAISYDVVIIQMGFLKKLIVETMENEEGQTQLKKALKQQIKIQREEEEEVYSESEGDEDRAMTDEKLIKELKKCRSEMCCSLLEQNISAISSNIHCYWQNHVNEIRHILSSKGNRKSPQSKSHHRNVSTHAQISAQQREQGKKFQTVKDLLFIQSEVSTYLKKDDSINEDFLEMIVSVMSIRNIHNPYQNNDEILIFGSKSITNLISKVKQSTLQQATVDKIMQLFLIITNQRARSQLSEDLCTVFADQSHNGIICMETLQLVKNLTRLKRGVADMELDFDTTIKAIQNFVSEEYTVKSFLDLSAITYNILYLCQNEEYSVREFAEHALIKILKELQVYSHQEKESLSKLIEHQLVSVYIVTVKDELTLKTVLKCLRSLIMFSKENNIETAHRLSELSSLCNLKEENLDFFICCLGIKLKDKQRCLKMLRQKLETGQFSHCLRTIEKVMMPLVDYLVFGGANQFQNKRNTISYDKDQKLNTLEDGLSIYTALASQLSWNDYYKLLKKLLFKLQRMNSKTKSVSSYGQPELESEKLITKAICCILQGFHFEEVKDAVEAMNENQKVFKKEIGKHTLWNNDLSDLLQNQIEDKEEEVADLIDDKQDEEESESEEVEIEDEAKLLSQDQIKDIQQKLFQKVLPVLERHLTENKDKHSVRGFVAVCYAKTIRKLPPGKFTSKLKKLVNLIVVQGLRSKDLSHREKARKALVKLVAEVSPQFLSLIFDEMKAQLTKGFQIHVYLFTVHHLLQGLAESNSLVTGSITSKMVDINIEVLLSELFGELDEEKSNVQNNERKIIRESKTRKALPIFEIMTQYSNFKTSFMHLLAPIINILETSPGFSKIQQCEDLLNRMSSSLMKNQTLEGSQFLLFLYSIIQRGVQMSTKIKINDDKAQRDYGAGPETALSRKTREEQKEMNLRVEMYWKKGNQTIDSKKTQEISGRILASFGIQCFKKSLKNKEIITIGSELDLVNQKDEQKAEMVARLDPFVSLILNSFKTYHNPIIVTSLHVITQIVGLGLPSFKELLKKFLNRIFKLFQQTQSADSDFINSLFKCTSELLKTYSIYQDLSEVQIKTLVEIIKMHVPKFAVQSNALQCLRSVVHRRFMCSELYDLIEQVQEMMVFNTSPSIRGLCASIFVQFLMDYPLSSERIEQHINFLIKNLGCKKLEGRIQLLEVIKTLLDKLPAELIELYCELLFFTLLLRAVNEENSNCRTTVHRVMKTLVFSPKINQSKIKTLLNTVLQMGSQESGKREMLLMSKMIAFQLIAQSGSSTQQGSSKLKQSEISQIFQTIHSDIIIIQRQELEQKLQTNLENYNKKEDSEEESNPQMASFLKSIELMEESQPEFEEPESTDQSKPWTLLYHALVSIEKLIENQDKKHIIQQVISLDLSQTIICFAQHHPNYWVRLISQRLLGHVFATQQAAKGNLIAILGLDIPEQLVEFTYSLINCLSKSVQTDEMREQIVKNLVFMTNTLMEQPEEEKGKIQMGQLYRKLSYIGRTVMLDIRTSIDRLHTILQFFNISLELFQTSDQKDKLLKDVCGPMLELVYRTYTDDQYEKGSQVKDLSVEIVELLQNKVDKPFFISTYNEIKKGILEKRNNRKIQQKQLVSTQEGLAMRATKRVKKQLKKKEKHVEKVFKSKLQ